MKERNKKISVKLLIVVFSLVISVSSSTLFAGSEPFQTSSMLSTSDVVLFETFDPPDNPFCIRKESKSGAPDPNILSGNPNSSGQFLRLQYDGTHETHYVSTAFDMLAVGAVPRIITYFDFKIHGSDADYDADGFCVGHIPTSINGTSGCSRYSNYGFFAEEPRLTRTFAIGFEIYDYTRRCPCNRIYVSWDRKWFPDSKPIDVPIDLDNGMFHRAEIDIRATGPNRALVTIILTPNIYDPNHGAPLTVVRNLGIGDPNHPYVPYESRVEFVGRNGGLDVSVDIDNIEVIYKSEVCEYVLAGDVNQDCVVDFFDLASISKNWLIDCNFNSDDPACIPNQ